MPVSVSHGDKEQNQDNGLDIRPRTLHFRVRALDLFETLISEFQFIYLQIVAMRVSALLFRLIQESKAQVSWL